MDRIEEHKGFLSKVSNNEPLKKFVYMHHWVSGCGTEVYPYALWECSYYPKVEVQLNVDLKGRYPNYKFYVRDEREISAIANALKQENPIVRDFYLRTNDGSCPPELVFELN